MHLESSPTSEEELFGGNSQLVKAAGYFRGRAPLRTFDRLLNATLPDMFEDIPPNV